MSDEPTTPEEGDEEAAPEESEEETATEGTSSETDEEQPVEDVPQADDEPMRLAQPVQNPPIPLPAGMVRATQYRTP
jgi:hypothetical protein